MLSPADAALCARDPALPGLDAVLDAEALARRQGLGYLRQTYLRYKPGTSCVAGLTSASGDLRAYAAMTYPPERYAELRARREWYVGPDPVVFFDDIFTVIVPLTRDRGLKAARALRMAIRRRRYLGHLGLDDDTPLTLLRYKPGRRLVLRADAPSGRAVVIKAHESEAFPGAAAGALHAERLAGATLVGVSDRYGSIAKCWVDGDVLDPVRLDADAFRQTGAELARLHLAAPRSGAPIARIDCDLHADSLAALLPDLATKASAAATEIFALLARLDPLPCVVHGDLSPDQVILGDGGPTVIDWDRMTIGDPAHDLGSFLARLDRDAIERVISDDKAETAGQAFLDGYATAAGGLPYDYGPHRASALLALASEGFRRRRPDWAAEAEAILERIDTLVRRRPRTPREPRQHAPTHGLAEALDPVAIGPKLASALGGGSAVQPTIRLLRHKAGRRALIRYNLAGQSPLFGKLRAKGSDRRTPRLHAALRQAGLDGREPHRVGVPEVLGEIEEPALWLQRLVPGTPLGTLLLRGGARDAAQLAGRALAILHGADVAPERSWSLTDELDVLDLALGDPTADRGFRDRKTGIRRAARDAVLALPPVRTTGVHRDYYFDQVLIDGDAVWLVDLDLFARSDPLLDVGNFLAHLTELGIRLHGDAATFQAEASAFLLGYEGTGGAPDPERLGVLHWVSLARHVGLSQRIRGRAHTTEALVSLCERGPQGADFIIRLSRSRQPAA